MADGTNPSQKLHCVASRTVVGMDALQQCEAPLCERPSPDAATTTSDFNPSDPLSGLVGRNYSIACKEGHAMLSDGWRVERQDTGICRVVSNDPYKVWQYNNRSGVVYNTVPCEPYCHQTVAAGLGRGSLTNRNTTHVPGQTLTYTCHTGHQFTDEAGGGSDDGRGGGAEGSGGGAADGSGDGSGSGERAERSVNWEEAELWDGELELQMGTGAGRVRRAAADLTRQRVAECREAATGGADWVWEQQATVPETCWGKRTFNNKSLRFLTSLSC